MKALVSKLKKKRPPGLNKPPLRRKAFKPSVSNRLLWKYRQIPVVVKKQMVASGLRRLKKIHPTLNFFTRPSYGGYGQDMASYIVGSLPESWFYGGTKLEPDRANALLKAYMNAHEFYFTPRSNVSVANFASKSETLKKLQANLYRHGKIPY